MGEAERQTLLAIIESTDPRVTPHERLRAIELLNEAGGSVDDGVLANARYVASLSDEALEAELIGYLRTAPRVNDSPLQRALDGRECPQPGE